MQNFNQKDDEMIGMKTPAEEYLERKLDDLQRTFEIEKELMKHGRKVHSGYMMTIGDLIEFFKKH